MGFANSSCSFTRFRILDPVPATLWPQILDKLKQFAMRDIDDIPEMQGQGWACFEDMLDTDWVTAPPQKGAYIVFSLRLDMRRIPAGVVKKHVALALKEEKKRMGEQGKVVVRVLIGADGLPQKAEIRTSSSYERLDQAALSTVMKWRYVPGKRAGVAEAMRSARSGPTV